MSYVVLHVAVCFWLSTRCSREQMKYADDEAIRLRFVPALVERLISGGFSPVRDRAKIVTYDGENGNRRESRDSASSGKK